MWLTRLSLTSIFQVLTYTFSSNSMNLSHITILTALFTRILSNKEVCLPQPLLVNVPKKFHKQILNFNFLTFMHTLSKLRFKVGTNLWTDYPRELMNPGSTSNLTEYKTHFQVKHFPKKLDLIFWFHDNATSIKPLKHCYKTVLMVPMLCTY